MEKETFEKAFLDSLNKNFETHVGFFDFDLYTYPELGTSIFEINKCLILGFYRASITLTNHVLERVLKLALIYNEVGLGEIPIEICSDVFSVPNEKYGDKHLGNTIELCKKENLITENEKSLLFDRIRELMRNGFSHSDPSKILKDLPDETTIYQGSFSDPSDSKEIKLNYKSIPIFQEIQMESFAKDVAFDYFKFVFGLMKRIDDRLKLKFDIK